MSILVTDAKGFVGQKIQGPDVVAFAGDISDIEVVRQQVLTHQPAAIIHLAAIASPAAAAREPAQAWKVNVLGTFNIAQALLELAPQARLIFAGSSESYGQSLIDAQGTRVRETAALRPLSRYGATKAAADLMLEQMAREGLQVVRFRPFNHTGPGQSNSYVASAFARQVASIERGEQEPVIRTGNLNVARDFCDVRDVVRAYLQVARSSTSSSVIGEAINLSSGRPMALTALLAHLIGRSTVSIAHEVDPHLVRTNEVATIQGDASKAMRLLGWKAEIPLTKTLDDLLDGWRRSLAK